MADQLDSVFTSVKRQLDDERAQMKAEFAEKEKALHKKLEEVRERMHSEWAWVMKASGNEGNVDAMVDTAEQGEAQSVERIVVLDVGGKRFKTTRDTLTKVPGSMLEAMFGGRHPLHPDKDGSFFIDNDGTYFGEVLNYLRHDKLVLPDDPFIKAKLKEDATYYGLDGLLEVLKPRTVVLEATTRRHSRMRGRMVASGPVRLHGSYSRKARPSLPMSPRTPRRSR